MGAIAPRRDGFVKFRRARDVVRRVHLRAHPANVGRDLRVARLPNTRSA